MLLLLLLLLFPPDATAAAAAAAARSPPNERAVEAERRKFPCEKNVDDIHDRRCDAVLPPPPPIAPADPDAIGPPDPIGIMLLSIHRSGGSRPTRR